MLILAVRDRHERWPFWPLKLWRGIPISNRESTQYSGTSVEDKCIRANKTSRTWRSQYSWLKRECPCQPSTLTQQCTVRSYLEYVLHDLATNLFLFLPSPASHHSMPPWHPFQCISTLWYYHQLSFMLLSKPPSTLMSCLILSYSPSMPCRIFDNIFYEPVDVVLLSSSYIVGFVYSCFNLTPKRDLPLVHF